MAAISSKQRGIIGAVLLLGFLIVHWIQSPSTPKTSDGQIPTSVQIAPGQVVFRQWSDLDEFHKGGLQLADSEFKDFQKIHPDGGTDNDQTAFEKQNEKDINVLRAKFTADGKILDVPVNTVIKIEKFYDENGNEVEPVWNAP